MQMKLSSRQDRLAKHDKQKDFQSSEGEQLQEVKCGNKFVTFLSDV